MQPEQLWTAWVVWLIIQGMQLVGPRLAGLVQGLGQPDLLAKYKDFQNFFLGTEVHLPDRHRPERNPIRNPQPHLINIPRLPRAWESSGMTSNLVRM